MLKFSICDYCFFIHFLLWSDKVFGAVTISTWLRNSDKLPWPFYILSDMCFSHSLSHDGRHVTHFGRCSSFFFRTDGLREDSHDGRHVKFLSFFIDIYSVIFFGFMDTCMKNCPISGIHGTNFQPIMKCDADIRE